MKLIPKYQKSGKIKISDVDERTDHTTRQQYQRQARQTYNFQIRQKVNKHNEQENKRYNHSDETVKKSRQYWKTNYNPKTDTESIVKQKAVMAPSEDSTNGVDPVGKFYTEMVATNPLFNLAGKGLMYGAGRLGSNWAKEKLIIGALNKSVNRTILPKENFDNVGWFPKQTIKVSHASNTDQPFKLYFPERWDAKNEGANPFGIWFQGKLGTIRTDLTNPGKGTKAFNARQLFQDRPFTYKTDLTLDKPMGTVGDVSDRAALSRKAEDMGADGIVYNDVYDNGYNHNQVVLSFRNP